MDEKIPVLLDTDIGSDIDDAVCLAYLLAEPRCDLLGVTTVTGQPRRRAMLANAVCRAVGRGDVPIASGSPVPILHEQRQPQAPQAEVLPRWPHREEFEPSAAVEFLRGQIRQRPGELTLLAVGPLTNVGLLFAVDPEVAGLLKRVVIMGGHYFEGRHEWNTGGDPLASQIVFDAALPDFTAYGLDVTLKCKLPADECRERMQGGPFEVVRDMAEVWFRKQEKITFHDPLAAAALFQPDLCEYSRGRIAAELERGENFGDTAFAENPEGPHRVARNVDAERFFDHYFGVTACFRE
jgi:inosine-uridine nucleoside N-ribohydrolase